MNMIVLRIVIIEYSITDKKEYVKQLVWILTMVFQSEHLMVQMWVFLHWDHEPPCREALAVYSYRDHFLFSPSDS